MARHSTPRSGFRSREGNGRARLGFRVPATSDLPAGHHRLVDPDGRVVEVDAE